MDGIVPNLWIGDLLSTYNTSSLTTHNITHVISLIEKPIPIWLCTKYLQLGITHTQYHILDEENVDILPILTETYDVIREKMEKGEGVLVHCGLGVSRSGAVVVGYLMRSQGIGRDEALKMAREKRPKIAPNKGFWEQIETWGNGRENE